MSIACVLGGTGIAISCCIPCPFPSSSPSAAAGLAAGCRLCLHGLSSPHRLYASSKIERYCPPPCFPFKASLYKQELEAAVDVVEKACRLCNDVQHSMMEGKEQMNKSDQSPVTVADFGIQALISMELGRIFPSIPLVAEEDATYLRRGREEAETAAAVTNDENGSASNVPEGVVLLDMVVEAVAKVASSTGGPRLVNDDDILKAIDRGYHISDIHSSSSTFWVLDPIDGTRGFLEGGDSLYVIGLALVVEGRLVLGVMGCPSVTHDNMKSRTGRRLIQSLHKLMKPRTPEMTGILVAASSGFGSWVKPLSFMQHGTSRSLVDEEFAQCFVDGSSSLDTAWCGLSRHEVWDSSPLAHITNLNSAFCSEFALSFCCGSLCKYMAVAVGAVSVVLLPQAKKHVKVWDHAAGVICVLEAGGKVTDSEGSEIEESLCKGSRTFEHGGDGILVTNGHLHSIILRNLHRRSGT